MSPAPPPASLAVIAATVDDRLREVLADEQRRWTAFDPDLDAPLQELARLVLGGGKRLRPAFTAWGAAAAGGDPFAAAVVDAGAAFELMHAFALFHDDVMDDAASRRGQPTTHVLFADRHRDGVWAGESRRFGEGIAILVGDLAFVYADRLLLDAPRPAWRIWNELRIELNIGQVLDILGGVQHDRRRDKAERICRYKSGKYTIERPLHLGAAISAPDRIDDLMPVLSAYGLPLGDAFQMRDDVMGAFGDPRLTGKPVGGDLREGKPTPLLARAVEAADPAQTRLLDRVGAPDLGDDEIAAIQQVIVDTGALADLETSIARLTDTAIDAITGPGAVTAGIPAGVRDELVALAHYCSQRQV